MATKESAAPFTHDELDSLSRALESAASHRELAGLFLDCGLTETFQEGRPKWQRIFNVVAEVQNKTQTGNFAMKLTGIILHPRRFVSRPNEHEEQLERVNRILAFRGFELLPSGKFTRTTIAQTVNEARQKANRLRSELERRNVHPDVLVFCRAELVQENYFHAVLEATKSVSEKIRLKSGLTGDGGELAQQAFALGKSGTPKIAFNPLLTDTHRSEQSGLMNLFIGMFGTFRNTTAHGAKIHWAISEQDALDLLTLVSLLHRRLDASGP